MRHWIFHPLIFYPLAILIAALAIAVSLKPQSWPREPAPAAAQVVEGALIYRGASFDAPAAGPGQQMTVVRDWLGRPRSLRIAIQPNQPAPSVTEQGVRILLSPNDAARLNNQPLTVEVSYVPSPVNTATGLALSIQGGAPTTWVGQDVPPQPSTVRFELPAQTAISAIGLRALTANTDQNYGIEITRIRVIPHA
jgi:hypothetical protein